MDHGKHFLPHLLGIHPQLGHPAGLQAAEAGARASCAHLHVSTQGLIQRERF